MCNSFHNSVASVNLFTLNHTPFNLFHDPYPRSNNFLEPNWYQWIFCCQIFCIISTVLDSAWRGFDWKGLSVLQNQCWELFARDPAGETANVVACVLRALELFIRHPCVPTAGSSEVGKADSSITHTSSYQHLLFVRQLWLLSVAFYSSGKVSGNGSSSVVSHAWVRQNESTSRHEI